MMRTTGEKMLAGKIQKILVSVDTALFLVVLYVLSAGLATTSLGLAIIYVWITVFLATIVSLAVHLSQGSDEWYQHGIIVITGIMVAFILGLLLGYDLFGILLLMPVGVFAVFITDWMFTDKSEDAITEDLKKLQKEIR